MEIQQACRAEPVVLTLLGRTTPGMLLVHRDTQHLLESHHGCGTAEAAQLTAGLPFPTVAQPAGHIVPFPTWKRLPRTPQMSHSVSKEAGVGGGSALGTFPGLLSPKRELCQPGPCWGGGRVRVALVLFMTTPKVKNCK